MVSELKIEVEKISTSTQRGFEYMGEEVVAIKYRLTVMEDSEEERPNIVPMEDGV